MIIYLQTLTAANQTLSKSPYTHLHSMITIGHTMYSRYVLHTYVHSWAAAAGPEEAGGHRFDITMH